MHGDVFISELLAKMAQFPTKSQHSRNGNFLPSKKKLGGNYTSKAKSLESKKSSLNVHFTSKFWYIQKSLSGWRPGSMGITPASKA
jgi:hypothetical protein